MKLKRALELSDTDVFRLANSDKNTHTISTVGDEIYTCALDSDVSKQSTIIISKGVKHLKNLINIDTEFLSFTVYEDELLDIVIMIHAVESNGVQHKIHLIN